MICHKLCDSAVSQTIHSLAIADCRKHRLCWLVYFISCFCCSVVNIVFVVILISVSVYACCPPVTDLVRCHMLLLSWITWRSFCLQEIDKGYTLKSKELNCLLSFTVIRLREKVSNSNAGMRFIYICIIISYVYAWMLNHNAHKSPHIITFTAM